MPERPRLTGDCVHVTVPAEYILAAGTGQHIEYINPNTDKAIRERLCHGTSEDQAE